MKEFITDLLQKINKSLDNKFYNLAKKQGSIYATINIPVNTAGYSILNPSYINENNTYSYCTISTDSSTSEVTIKLKKGIYFISSQLTILPASNTAQFAGQVVLEVENDEEPIHLQELVFIPGPNGSQHRFTKSDILVIEDWNKEMKLHFKLGGSGVINSSLSLETLYTITPLNIIE